MQVKHFRAALWSCSSWAATAQPGRSHHWIFPEQPLGEAGGSCHCVCTCRAAPQLTWSDSSSTWLLPEGRSVPPCASGQTQSPEVRYTWGGWVWSDLWWRFNLALSRVLSPSECWSIYAGKPFLFSCLSFRGSKRLKLKYQLIELAPTNLMNSACPGWASSAEKEMDCAPTP